MKTTSYKDYENIIFDLGGVVIDLDTDRTVQAFADFSKQPFEQARYSFQNEKVFTDYEMGQIDDATFRNGIRELFGQEASDEEVDAAWNAMLLEIPKSKIDLIRFLQGKHRLFVLSNTNAIHIRKFNQILKAAHGYESLDPLFETIYYSHDVGLRKPNIDIFEHVINDGKMEPTATVFLDDNAMNVAAAQKTGIHTLHVTSSEVMLGYFED